MLYDRSFVPKKTPVLWAVLIFFGVVAIADIFGVNFERSLWSNFERMEGLVTFIYLCVFFLVSSTILSRMDKWKAFWNVSVVASVGMALYALLQAYGTLSISQGGARVDATMGNSIYLAVYMLFHIFLTLWLLYGRRRSWPYVTWYLIAIVLQLLALYNTGTRGTVLGLIGGLGITSLIIALKGKEHPRLRALAIGSIAFMILFVGIFVAFRDTDFVKKSAILNRFTSISFSEGTGYSRAVLWSSIAFDGFKERPLLGWGQDNFLIVFGKYYDARMNKQEPWFDRAHNVFFDWLISAGILGLLAYLSLFGVSLYVIWKQSSHFALVERSIGTGLFAGYFVHNIFVFDNLISYIFFFLFLGFISSSYVISHSDILHKYSDRLRYRFILGVVAFIVIAVLTYATTIPHIQASKNIIKGIVGAQQGDFYTPLELFTNAVKDPVADDEARFQLSRVAFSIAASSDPSITEEIKQAYLETTLLELEKSAQHDPDNTRAKFFLAMFYARIGDLAEAKRLFEELLSVNPDRQIFLSEYGLILALTNEYQLAEEVLSRFQEIAPESQEAATRYSAILFLQGKRDEAQKALAVYAGNTFEDGSFDLSIYGTPTTFEQAFIATTFETERIQMRLEERGYGEYLLKVQEYANNNQKQKALIFIKDMLTFFPNEKEKTEALREAVIAGKEIIIKDSVNPTQE